MMILQKLKGWAIAGLAFVATFFAARFYKEKADRLETELKKEKSKSTNYERQIAVVRKKAGIFDKEIKDALKGDDFLNYFDD